MKHCTFLGLCLVASIVATPLAPQLSAHHSFAAEYDANKPLNMKGAVTKIE